jgi:hypothetical protein
LLKAELIRETPIKRIVRPERAGGKILLSMRGGIKPMRTSTHQVIRAVPINCTKNNTPNIAPCISDPETIRRANRQI